MNWHLILAAMVFSGLAMALAQTEERPEGNKDLRGAKSIALIEKLATHETVSLERTTAGELSVVHALGEETKHNKIARAKAEAWDQRFAEAFLKVQYELPEDAPKCSTQWRLMLRGEEYRFCNQNDKKNQVVEPLFQELKAASNL